MNTITLLNDLDVTYSPDGKLTIVARDEENNREVIELMSELLHFENNVFTLQPYRNGVRVKRLDDSYPQIIYVRTTSKGALFTTELKQLINVSFENFVSIQIDKGAL